MRSTCCAVSDPGERSDGGSDTAAGSERGAVLGASAFFIWGLFPAFFGLLRFAGAVDVLAHRVVWTLVFAIAVLLVLGRIGQLTRIGLRTWGLVAAASALITINWGTYIYGVISGNVVECALGYFITPLVVVVMGVVLFREKVNRAQAGAVALAVVAVVVLTIDYGHPPWLALVLAASFASYGLVKKVVPLEPVQGLAAEGLIAAPVALVFLVVTAAQSGPSASTPGQWVLLIITGPVTMLPLVLFSAAAQRVPLVTLGLLQYITPALQMAWGVWVNHEPMPVSRWIGFGLIWAALTVFTADSVRRLRQVTVGV